VNQVLIDGGTFNDFKKLVEENEIILSEPYLKNVFRTNIQTAYGHGRWQQQQRNKAKRPYLMYVAINDSRVRPSHLALNRIIRHIDDPFWLKYYAPWDFMCRCTIIALTEEQALKYGITADEDLPVIADNNGWSTSPLTFGEMQSVVDTKIANSILIKSICLVSSKMSWLNGKRVKSYQVCYHRWMIKPRSISDDSRYGYSTRSNDQTKCS
jgi:SPP1 gp7 family putative phage head morphogenesis protein